MWLWLSHSLSLFHTLLSLTLSLSHSLTLTLILSHTQTHGAGRVRRRAHHQTPAPPLHPWGEHSLTFTHTHSLALSPSHSLSLSHSHARTLSLSLSLSLTLSRTHTVSLSCNHPLCLPPPGGVSWARHPCSCSASHPRKVDIRLPGKGDSNSHGARPVHQKHRWTRTSRLSIKNSLSLLALGVPTRARCS